MFPWQQEGTFNTIAIITPLLHALQLCDGRYGYVASNVLRIRNLSAIKEPPVCHENFLVIKIQIKSAGGSQLLCSCSCLMIHVNFAGEAQLKELRVICGENHAIIENHELSRPY